MSQEPKTSEKNPEPTLAEMGQALGEMAIQIKEITTAVASLKSSESEPSEPSPPPQTEIDPDAPLTQQGLEATLAQTHGWCHDAECVTCVPQRTALTTAVSRRASMEAAAQTLGEVEAALSYFGKPELTDEIKAALAEYRARDVGETLSPDDAETLQVEG